MDQSFYSILRELLINTCSSAGFKKSLLSLLMMAKSSTEIRLSHSLLINMALKVTQRPIPEDYRPCASIRYL